jgi:cytoskeletal protein CcmA (bactofilin family)
MKNLRRLLYLKIARMGRGSSAPVPSIISFGTKIKGNVLGGDVIHIDGRLDGNVLCEELIIGVKGQVAGQVKAKSLSIYGLLQGSAEAENIFVAGQAKVLGDIYHKTIAIEPGAYIEGRCIRAAKNDAEKAQKETAAPAKTATDPSLFVAQADNKSGK